MLTVACYSGYRVNERPVAFTLSDKPFKVEEIIDRWYGKEEVYFKIRANDQNIYLLKYDAYQDCWDLVFYQNPGKLKVLSLAHQRGLPPALPVQRGTGSKPPFVLN